MQLHDKQKEFINSPKRFKLLNWGRRTGKTTAVAYEIFTTLWNIDGALVSYYAPTFSDARDIAWSILKEVLEPITIKTNESLLEITVRNHKGTNSLLRLSGWEAVKNREKGRGVENNLVVLDECAFYPEFIEKFQKVIEPTLLTSKGSLILTSTPNGFNHFYDLSNDAQSSSDWFYSHATSYDNPFNDPAELERLRITKDPDAFAQEYMADFRKVQGLVYKEFDRNRHLFTEYPLEQFIASKWVSVDWGFTNPSAIYSIDEDKDGNFWIYNEYYKTGKTNDELLDILRSRKAHGYYPDPAEPDRLEVMRRSGLSVREVNKDIKLGIDAIRTLLIQNRIKIHKDCVNLINELETYCYPEDSKEIPIKENDHALDSIRYCLVMRTTQKVKTKVSISRPTYSNQWKRR